MSYRSRRERRYRQKQAKAAALDPNLTRGWGPDSQISRGDLRRVATAIRRGWDVPPNVRAAIVARVEEILDSGKSETADARLLVAAAYAVIEMVGDNIRAEMQRFPTGNGSRPPNTA